MRINNAKNDNAGTQLKTLIQCLFAKPNPHASGIESGSGLPWLG
jgi:hypothetical protein